MNLIKTNIKDLYVIELKKFSDDRGWFLESFNKSKSTVFEKITFVQDNHSMSTTKGTIRGIHLQSGNFAQTKLVRCTKGSIIDVAVDLRRDSPTYKKSFSIELSDRNLKQLLIPKGFGHAFLTLTDNVEVQYKVDEFYNKESEISIRYDDKDIAINWPKMQYVVSEKILEQFHY